MMKKKGQSLKIIIWIAVLAAIAIAAWMYVPKMDATQPMEDQPVMGEEMPLPPDMPEPPAMAEEPPPPPVVEGGSAPEMPVPPEMPEEAAPPSGPEAAPVEAPKEDDAQ